MKDKLILVLAFVLACILVFWGYHKREATPRQNIPLSQNQNMPSHIPAASKSIQTAQKDSIFHLYSPLRDSPPAPTPDQIEIWSESLNAMLLKGMTPDFAAPPLASIFHLEATKAESGDTKAAMTLFKGLDCCRFAGHRDKV